MRRLEGKAALVTGGARGIGFAIAQRFAEEGASVAVLALHEESAARAADQIAGAVAITADVCDEEGMARAVRETVEAFGRLDLMVNNAGTIAITPVVETSVEIWDRVVGVNLRGVFLGCREAARQLIAQGEGGRIVNGSSGAGPGHRGHGPGAVGRVPVTVRRRNLHPRPQLDPRAGAAGRSPGGPGA